MINENGFLRVNCISKNENKKYIYLGLFSIVKLLEFFRMPRTPKYFLK